MRKLVVIIVCLAVLGISSLASAAVLFRLPLASNPGISAWFDHNSTSAKLRYDCNTNFEYDEHHGTDFATAIGTSVYAGATGSLYYFVNNCPDGSNQTCGSSYGNHARISHSLDGHVSIYAHMEQGTVGYFGSYMCGTYIGQSGNSGYGTGPHLHFELWSDQSTTQRLDFFGGACGGSSYWVNQNGGSPTTQCQ